MKKTFTLLFFLCLFFVVQATESHTVATTAGNLATDAAVYLTTVTDLTVTGTIDARDFVTMRDNMSNLAKLDLSGATIAKYTGSATNGSTTYPANEIPEFAFCTTSLTGKASLTSITLPSGITSIGGSAFYNCTGFTGSLTIPSAVTTIGCAVFSGCSGFTGSLTIPSSVTSIGCSAFSDCSNISSIKASGTTPGSIILDQDVFNGMHTSTCVLNVPVGTKALYAAADQWKDFTNIIESPVDVTTPGTLGTILTSDQLSNLTSLTVIGTIDARDFKTMRDNMPHLATLDLSGATIVAYTGTGGTGGTTSITYPANGIPQNAFGTTAIGGNTILKSIAMPASVTSIGDDAFFACGGLTGPLTIPSTVTSIGKCAFLGCRGFTGSLTIPSSVTYIGDTAFGSCDGFTGSLTIPSSVTSIGGGVFSGCSGFTGLLTIPSSVTSIGDAAFKDCTGFIGPLTIPSLVTSIGDAVFLGCSGLTGSLTIPSSVTSIGFAAFYNCIGFTGSLTIPSSVTFIGAAAFQDCSHISSIKASGTTPGSITLDQEVFKGMNTSTCVLNVPVGTKALYAAADQWKDFTNIIESPVNVTTPGTLGTILTSDQLSNLTSLTVTGTIDARDFKTMRDNMPLLATLDISGATIAAHTGTDGTVSTNVTYPANEIPQYSFYNTAISTVNTSLTSISLPSSVTSIGNNAFQDCSSLVGSLTIPSTLTTIGNNVFTNSGVLFTVDGANPNYSSEDDVLFNKDKTMLIQCPISKTGSYTIPSSVTSIGESAFYNCSSITGSLTIPSLVTSIGTGAFVNCIGFAGSLTIPASITSIGGYAFYGCSNISSIKAYGATPSLITLGSSAFVGMNTSTCVLHVPAGTKDLYEAADQWKAFKPNITDDLVIAPAATTTAASSVTSSGAILNGTINAYGASTVVTFEYGLTTSYGTAVTAAQSPVGVSAKAVSYTLTGLTPNSTYHYRVVGVNSEGTTNGQDQTFTTLVGTPTITAISPTSGPITGGTSVVITGTDLTAATAVKFGSNSATITANTATSITATSPAGSAGTVDVTVATAGGTSATSSADQFTYVAVPTITAISPTAGSTVGGTTVTITGTNLTGVTAVKFGSTNATGFTVNSATQITATAPARSVGTVDITVTTVGVTSASSSADQFTYVAAPAATTNAATSISSTGATLAGSINAKNGSTTVTFEYGLTTSYGTAVTADQSPVTGSVATPVSKAITGLAAGVTYHYRVVGVNAGGRTNGLDQTFTTGATAPTESFYEQITLPFAPTDDVDMSSSTLAPSMYLPSTSNSYPSKGYKVTLLTSGKISLFALSNEITPNNFAFLVSTSYDASSSSQKYVAAGNGTTATLTPGTYYIVLLTNNVYGKFKVNVTFAALPNITSIAPTSGTTAGGTTVTITGTNFTGATAVKFGSTNATSYTVDSDTQITAVSPAGSAGTMDVTVTTAGGISATSSADQFVYQQPQTITFNALSTHTYGDAPFILSAAGGASGNPVVFTSSDPTVATCTGTNGTTITLLKTGSCTIIANQAGNAAYEAATPVSQTLTVNALPVTITANTGQNKVYGESDAAFAYSVSPALKAGDAFTGALARDAGENVGNYAISQGTLSASSNYTLSFVSKDFAITPKAITVTANAATKVYGTTDPTFTYTHSPALLGTDAFTGNLSRAAGENVGDYAIAQGTLSAGNNYTILFVSKNFAITSKAITVTANAGQTKIYGDADPALTYTVFPALVGTDAFTGNLSRAPGEDVGTYAINQGTLSAGANYAISFADANFNITAKPITVTANASQSKVYGESDAPFTYSVSPALKAGDAFTGALAREVGENVGTYAINQGTLSPGDNYAINFVGNKFSITAKPIIVTANASQSKVYGESDAAFTYSVSPALKAGDSFTGALAREAGENVGRYAINQGTLSAGDNYAISFAGDNFSITAKPITVTVDGGQTKMAGAAEPVLTYIVHPALVNGDAFTGALARESGEIVGTYAINQGTLSPGVNYSVTFVGNSFSITPPSFTISGNAGIAGATLSYFDGTDKTVVAAADGSYSITVPAYWSGTVTPSLAGYSFSANKEYTNVSANLSGENYTATDIVAPTMQLSYSSDKEAVKAGDIITFTATFSDANGISESPAPTITIGSVVVNDAMNKTSNLVWTYTWTVPANVDATVAVSVTATDPDGNRVTGGLDIRSYVIDNTPPAAIVTNISSQSTVHVLDNTVIGFSEQVVQVEPDLSNAIIFREGGKNGVDLPFTVSSSKDKSSRANVMGLKTAATGITQIVAKVALKCNTSYYLALKAGTFADMAGNLLPLYETTFNTDPNPAKPVIAGTKASLCSGDVLTCSNADASLAYIWQKDGKDISGASGTAYTLPDNAAGAYSLKVTDNVTSCASVSDVATITEYPAVTPVVYEKKQPGVISILVVDNTSNAFTSYQWTYADGSALPSGMVAANQFLVLNPENMNAAYKVTTTDNNGCKRLSASKSVTVKSASVVVYPTVSSQRFTVNYADAKKGNAMIRVVNSRGEVIQTLSVAKSSQVETYDLNLGYAPVGVYYIELQMGGFKDTKRVIISR